ncbi:MAG TPA: hypothetical protein VK504_12745 [Vicinamibacterales bacterium]|nr:hypothetical protein [Vicinamibacterales bacterium]
MSLDLGSIRQVGDATARDVAILDVNGNQLSGFDASRPANAARTILTFTGVAQLILAANAARRQVFITNLTNKPLFIGLGTAPTVTDYDFQIAVGQTYISDLDAFTGAIHGILSGTPSGVNKVNVCQVTT